MHTSFVHWLYVGHALASRHPLFFQWVTRERQREKELFLSWRFDLGLTRCWAAPHVHLGELSRIHRVRLEYLHGSVGCCKWTTSTFVDVWFGTLACIKFIVSFIWRERKTEHSLERENMKLNNHLRENYFGGMAVFTFGIEALPGLVEGSSPSSQWFLL